MPSETLKLVFLLCCWILLFCPQIDAALCGSTKTFTVSEGDDIVLRSNHSPSLSYITWDFEKHLIAITRPRRPLQLAEYSFKYSGRLSSSTDGSLMINNLIAEDERIYRADVFDRNSRYLCVQVYDLRMEERDGSSPNVDSLEYCGPTKQFLFRLGESITLRLLTYSRVAYVEWDINNIDHIAITRPGGMLLRPYPSYHGKISAIGDGSLKLSNLTTKDQQVYRAEHFTDKWSHLCTQYYDFKVKGIMKGLPGNHGLQIYIRLALSACILIATFSILFYHIKTENC